jgi:hypothetical protein
MSLSRLGILNSGVETEERKQQVLERADWVLSESLELERGARAIAIDLLHKRPSTSPSSPGAIWSRQSWEESHARDGEYHRGREAVGHPHQEHRKVSIIEKRRRS